MGDLDLQAGGCQLCSLGCKQRPLLPSKWTTLAWSDGRVGTEMLEEVLWGHLASQLERLSWNTRNRPTLNSKNFQSSNHQLHLLFVPVRKLETQSSAETFPRLPSSLESAAVVEPLSSACCITRTQRSSTSPSDSVGSSERKGIFL